jgi:hypothetical protein
MMSMELSNKTLAWLVVAAILVSIGGTIISLNKLGTGVTGFAAGSNKTGYANVTITSTTTLNFAVSGLNFGTGIVPATGNLVCNMSNFNNTEINKSYVGCELFNNNTAANGWLQIENAGNTPINVSLNFSTDAYGFIGGGSLSGIPPKLRFKVGNNGTEVGSCTDMNAGNWTTWTDVTNNTFFYACYGNNGLRSADPDSLAIGINITIPYDSPAALKTLVIQANGWN